MAESNKKYCIRENISENWYFSITILFVSDEYILVGLSEKNIKSVLKKR